MKKAPARALATTKATPEASAQAQLSSAMAAFRVMEAAGSAYIRGESQAVEMIVQLREREEAIQRGDLSQAEAMLFSQAEALQTLFVRMTERGLAQSSMDNLTGFMRLALKAQSQCRATLETLATIKNPPIFARQVNQTTGPQQVNNRFDSGSRAEKKQNEQNQLSTDARTTCPPVRGDSPMEALGAVNRTQDSGR